VLLVLAVDAHSDVGRWNFTFDDELCLSCNLVRCECAKPCAVGMCRACMAGVEKMLGFAGQFIPWSSFSSKKPII
jgi:hypothetical protein